MVAYLEDSTVNGEEYEDPRCHGCGKPIDDGSVVQFGEGIWHFECFRCSKCHDLVECYINLLLLRDGSPICEKCSYNCRACNKTIKDEAIMAGDDPYHAECFRCVQCHTKIDDLIFTQTDKGIFCTQCHETRKELRQKRKDERHRQHQKAHGTGSSEHFPSRNSDQPSSDEQKCRPYAICPDLRTSTSPNTRQPLPPMADRHLSTNSILDDYADLLPITAAPSSTTSEQIYQQMQATSSEISMRELIELNNMLNAAIQSGVTDKNIPSPPPESHDLLAMSTRKASNDTHDLHHELERTKTKLANVEMKFDQIKDISRKALDEYNKMKECFDTEITSRQNAEEKMIGLQNELSFYHQLELFGSTDLGTRSREELAQLHQVKAQVDKTVNDLRKQRDTIFGDIDSWDRFSLVQQQQLDSLQHDIDGVKLNYDRLTKARDDIIAEMIMLNNKNAELSTLNNDLSRKISEREREAMAFMKGTGFLTEESMTKASESSSRHSSFDQQHVSQNLTAHRKSLTNAMVATTPRKFKFGRNRSKSSGHDNDGNDRNNVCSGDSFIELPNGANVTVSVEKSQQGQLLLANHLFNHTKFLRPSKCDVCGEKMWRANELKCQECHYICHTKCVYRANSCHRNLVSISSNTDGQRKVSIFGQELVKQVQSEDNQVPLVIRKCIEAVEQCGMGYEGIYRKSGGAGQIRSIQQLFEQNEEINLCDEDQWNDICAVTSVLKQYFRDLPNPLFTYEHHQKWVEAILSDDSKSKMETFQRLLYILPTEHLTTLKYLMQHLARVNARNNENLMTARNLAVVFGPTLMRHMDENMDLVEMNHKIGCIEFILNHMEIFDDPVPEVNKSAPLPIRENSLPIRHRREASFNSPAPTVPPREKAGLYSRY